MKRSLFHRIVCLSTAASLLSGCSLAPFQTPSHDPHDAASAAVAAADGANDEESDVADETYEGRYKLARFSEQRGMKDRAGTMYLALLKENPADARVHHRLGILKAQSGKFEEANQHLEQARALAGPNPALLCDIGYLFYLQQRYADAEQVLRQALAAEPNNKAASNNLALVLGETARFDECLAMFQRAGSNAEAHANLAYVYGQIGAEELAIATYSKALSLDPSLTSAADAMMQLADRQRVRQGLPPLATPQPRLPAAPPKQPVELASAGAPQWGQSGRPVNPIAGGPDVNPAHAIALASHAAPGDPTFASSSGSRLPAARGSVLLQPPMSVVPPSSGQAPAGLGYEHNSAFRAAQAAGHVSAPPTP